MIKVNYNTGSFKKSLVVYTAMVVKNFNGVKFNLSGSMKTYNCLKLREGSIILAVFPDKSYLLDENLAGKMVWGNNWWKGWHDSSKVRRALVRDSSGRI